jgi:hypothetical protein
VNAQAIEVSSPALLAYQQSRRKLEALVAELGPLQQPVVDLNALRSTIGARTAQLSRIFGEGRARAESEIAELVASADRFERKHAPTIKRAEERGREHSRAALESRRLRGEAILEYARHRAVIAFEAAFNEWTDSVIEWGATWRSVEMATGRPSGLPNAIRPPMPLNEPALAMTHSHAIGIRVEARAAEILAELDAA